MHTASKVFRWKRSLALTCAAILWVTAAPSSDAGLFDVNLLVNPGAEDGPAGNGGSVTNIPGWQTNGGFTVVSYEAGGGFPGTTDPGPTDRGAAFFSGGDGEPLSTGSQLIDISSASADVDTGAVNCELSGYLGGFSSQGDNATLTVSFRDAASGNLGGFTIGPVTALDRTNATGLLFRQSLTAVPTGTRYLSVLLQMTRTDGSFNDGYADNLSVVLMHGGPVLTIDRQGRLVRVSWPTNNVGFQLETKDDLSSPAPWTNYPDSPGVVGEDFFITTTPDQPQQFFRLRK